MKRLNVWIILTFMAYSTRALSVALPGIDAAPWVSTDLKGNVCSGNRQGFGPFDYTNPAHRNQNEGGDRMTVLRIVERGHFPPNTEKLIKPVFNYFTADFDYTLMAWPNHHRALLSAVRFDLDVRNKIRKPEDSGTPPLECYFKRAINFAPKDWVTYSIYGYYLHKIGELEKAKPVYEAALKIKPDESKLEYSYSYLLIDMKLYDQAVEHARNAYKLGKPPKGLKEKLKALGVWKESEN